MLYSNYYCTLPKIGRTQTGNTATQLKQSYRPKMNVQKDDAQITLEFSLAGIQKEDVKMNLKDQLFNLEAIRKVNPDEKNYQHREFGPVEYKTSIQLPEDVDAESIKAKYQNGILRISMNRIKKPTIQVEIK